MRATVVKVVLMTAAVGLLTVPGLAHGAEARRGPLPGVPWASMEFGAHPRRDTARTIVQVLDRHAAGSQVTRFRLRPAVAPGAPGRTFEPGPPLRLPAPDPRPVA